MHDDATVLDIVLACRRVQRFAAGIDEPQFCTDEQRQWAVVSQLVLIGEAVKRLSDAFRTQYSEIPWQQIAGMRDRLIHGYDKINWSIVWKTAVEDVPQLLAALEPLVPSPAEADQQIENGT